MEFNKVYSFILSPGEDIKEKIKSLKQFCKSIIGNFPSVNSIAHITFSGPTTEKPANMLRMAKRLQHDLKSIPSMDMYINNFNYFKSNTDEFVIYAVIEMDNGLKNWFKELKLCFNDTEKIIPHITIARGLTSEQFAKLWPNFSDRAYQQMFTITAATILEGVLKLGDSGFEKSRDVMFKHIPFGDANVKLKQAWTLFDAVA